MLDLCTVANEFVSHHSNCQTIFGFIFEHSHNVNLNVSPPLLAGGVLVHSN